MADGNESKFLRFQDPNGDGYPDPQYPGDPNGCPDVEPSPEICLPCSPNPLATVPNWKTRNVKTPFLNEKLCKYQAPYATQDTTLNNIEEMWEKYASPYTDYLQRDRDGAIIRILRMAQKDMSSGSIDIVKQSIEHTDYWLEARPGSYAQLLYSVDFDVIDELPDLIEEEEEPVEEPGDLSVTYDAHDMVVWSIRVRKGLNLYNRYYKVFRAMENANLVFSTGPHSGKILDLERYGDFAIFGNGLLTDVINQLDSWLNVRGFNIANSGGLVFFKDKVEKLELLFDPEFNIKKLKVWSQECRERPVTYGKKDLEDLRSRSAWRDKTAVAYFARMEEFQADLSARVEQPWQEVLKKYTYPEIHSTIHAGHQDIDEKKDIPGCIADALENEFKQLGQDILDDVFSLGDAIAYAFHKNLCRHDPSEVSADNAKVGKNFGVPEVDDGTNMWSAAILQANKEIDPRDQVFAHFCLRLLSFDTGGSPIQMVDDLWAGGFDRIKICGLLDLLMQVMDCLLGGLTLEDALRKILQSALKAMSWEDFGELFVGLPPDKQEELDALVKKNLSTPGRLLPNAEQSEYETDEIGALAKGNPDPFIPKYEILKPWDNPKVVQKQKESMRNNNGTMVPTSQPLYGDIGESRIRSTLSQKVFLEDEAGVGSNLDPNLVMDAYMLALLEVYGEDYLGLVDKLNKFPGAQIISLLITTIECPRPPLFNPGAMDFIKSLGFPFCRSKNEIVVPRFENPFFYIPSIKDIIGAIKKLLKRLLMQLVISIIVKILVKICELIGDAVCKALELTGDIVAGIPSMVAGRRKFHDIVKESICGPDADDDLVNNTVTQLMNDLGVGAQALANPDRSRQFIEDISSAITQNELVSAVLGDPSRDALSIIDEIRSNSFPEYDEALPNEDAIGSFFENVGYLMPAKFRSDLRDAQRALGPDDETPVNPTLCATPEKLEEFKNMRCQLLEGRATPEQCEYMFDKWRGSLLDDLGEVADIASKGIGPVVTEQLPPLFSDPGCDNGMIPRESEQAIAAATTILKQDMEKLKMAFSSDMLDNGPGKTKWGMINMVMSDTMGLPYTTHQRKVFNKKDYVDFYVDPGDLDGVDWDQLFGRPIAALSDQEGAFPIFVAEWLMYQFQRAGKAYETPEEPARSYSIDDLQKSINFDSSNEYQDYVTRKISFDRLDIDYSNINITSIPSPGYNVDVIPNLPEEKVYFIKAPRKKHSKPDVVLEFKDNAKGYRVGPNGGQSEYAYGFDIRCYFSDIHEWDPDDPNNITSIAPSTTMVALTLDATGSTPFDGTVPSPTRTPPKIMVNRPDDNVRLYITERFNQDSRVADEAQAMAPASSADDKRRKQDMKDEEHGVIKFRKFEFLAIDDGLESLRDPEGQINLTMFPSLAESFERHTPFAPQVLALYDLMGGEADYIAVKSHYDDFMQKQFEKVAADVGHNSQAWIYGAAYDDLTFDDFTYVVPQSAKSLLKAGEPGMSISAPYDQVQVQDYNSRGEPDGLRDINEDDMILGVSLDQFNNGDDARVIYLDPAQYGGSYMNPPLYVKPLTGTGWSGIVDLMFPELSPCKPRKTDVVDFSEVQDRIDAMYPRIPDDERLKSDPDCIVEVPYNRILDRAGKAGLMGVILGTIRCFVGVHFLKSLATFSQFAPKFPTNYSNVYAHYIIERMEESLTDAGHNFLQPFKDTEFWYAFLEQSVQLYAYRIRNGDTPGIWNNGAEPEVPVAVEAALQRLDEMQEDYNYPYEEDLWDAILRGESRLQTLKSYREDKNLKAVYETADDAKIVLKELVLEQLREIGQKFAANLGALDMRPAVNDLDFYFLNSFAAGADFNLDLDPATQKLMEFPAGLPTEEDPDPTGQGWEWPGPFYTNGDEFTTVDDNTYVGYYRAYIDETDNGTLYVMGDDMSISGSSGARINPEQIEDANLLRPFANKVILGISSSSGFEGIGDVDPYTTGVSVTPEQPFILQKYISINGSKMNPDTAVSAVRAHGGGNISDHYPGSMRLVRNDEGDPIGVDGKLGVRYGLALKMGISGVYANTDLGDGIVAAVEINALDVPVTSFTGVEANSKLLWCLIGKLKEDPRFRILVDYIFSLKKVLGITAIYNDMGFLPSIGEYTVENGDLHGRALSFLDNAANEMPVDQYAGSKPGMYAKITMAEGPEIDGETSEYVKRVDILRGARGWASIDDRNSLYSPFYLDFEEWDKRLLRRTSRLAKKMFQVYYRSRDWGEAEESNAAAEWLEQLRERFKLSPGARFLPWWKKNRLRGNPYNADGALCDKPD